MKNKKVIIVGGVAGGATTAARLRRLDEKAEIIMFEKGDYISFANCGLPYYIGGVVESRAALLVQTVEGMKSKYNIDVRVGSEVLSIDKEKKTVKVKDLKKNEEYEESYDYLVLSTGAVPVKPRIPGLDEAKNLFTLRNIPDMDAIKEYIDTFKPQTATVVGGGFIGLEMAENLDNLGLKVTIVEMADQVMLSVDFELAQILHQHIREKGVNLILGDGVKSFENKGKQTVLQSGKVVDNDIILFSIGVKPENALAKDAGLLLGERGGVIVDDFLKTSDPSIYAIGDVIEVKDFVSGNKTMIPLAGPANKQGRIAASNIAGLNQTYPGTLGTAIAKVFDYTVASTGNNEKQLIKNNIVYQAIHIHPSSHAGYYPGAEPIALKVLFDPVSLKILGAEAVGKDGVDKRIDIIATAIYAGLKVTDLKNLELAYAPAYGNAKDPINMIGFIADNIVNGLVKTEEMPRVKELIKNGEIVVDVREVAENVLGTIDGSINLPLSTIRDHLNELDKNKTIYVFCQVGLRGYLADRILTQNGFKVVNLDGGYKTFKFLYLDNDVKYEGHTNDEGHMQTLKKEEKPIDLKAPEVKIKVDACGLQCPGPIVEVYKTLQNMKDGEVLEATATDPGFFNDIKNWTEKTGNTLMSLEKGDKTVTALIKKGTTKETNGIDVKSDKENTTIVVFSEDLDKALASFIIAQGAASMGKKVSMFFTFWGLNILRKPKKVRVKKTAIEKMFGSMMPRGTEKLPISKMNMGGMGSKMIKSIMKKKNVDSLSVMIENAKNLGVKITACAMSMDIMGIKREELIDGIEVSGVASYLADTTEANHNLFI
ncbi:MAG: CoA-disulfide reductase [Bacillales bacterium]|nr:CoA-disulfide reductase [Bacillales bacterium]